jgi:hypothetical protein
MGASQANGLGSPEGPEPHSGLRPAGAIPSAARPCPFCKGKAFVYDMFPRTETPWFVHVDHAEGCEIGCADGYRQCHETATAALASWNGESA